MSETDLELLQCYTRDHAEDAFAEIVRRHLDLVHSAALRQIRSPQLAEEVSQSVFTDLARNATKLKPDTILTAWLYQVTRHTAIDVVRKEARRQLREQIATEMNAMNATTADWTHIEPLLDDAMSALDETDRAAVLLRYFENKSLREVGATLGTSDDAAQKRVSRAVEHLREFFTKRGVTVGVSGLAIVISANAVQAAPVGLAVTISTATAITGTAVSTTATATTIKAIAMTTMQKTIIGATLAVAVGAGVYEARQASTLKAQVENLHQRQSPFAEQLRQLNADYTDATNRLAVLRDDNERLNRNTLELLKLRGEVARLRRDSQELAQLTAGKAQTPNDSESAEMNAVLARVNELKQMLNQKPDLKIPELEFLTPQDWLNVAAGAKLDTDSGARVALSRLRAAGKLAFSPMLEKALTGYVQANGGQLPTEILQLKPFFNPPVDDALLDRYQLLTTGKASDLPAPKQSLSGESAGDGETDRIRFRPPTSEGSVISEKARVDGVFDSVLSVGLNGSHLNEVGPVGSALDAVTRSTILRRGLTRTNN